MTDKDNDGWTVMLAAAHGGSVDAIEFMLANGGSVIEERSDGRTLMMFAAQGGSVEVMKYILANGGNLSGVLSHCSTDETTKFCRSCGAEHLLS